MSSVAVIGEHDLNTLLSTLNAVLHEPVYVFSTMATLPNDTKLLSAANMIFREAEGVTLILPLVVAESRKMSYTYESRMITCNVHSSLAAVGFLAGITNALKDAGISVNPVSAYYHDHLFVPVGREMEAVEILKKLAQDAMKKIEDA